MRKYWQNTLTEVAKYIELLLAAFFGVTLLYFGVTLFAQLVRDVSDMGGNWELLQEFLGQAMTLAIGVELIKMLSKPSANTVIEVLLFAISRQLVIEHPSTLNFLLGILAVAVLFAVRKYLFVPFEASSHVVMRGSHPVTLANLLAQTKIQALTGENLGEFVVRKLREEEKTVSIGACVYLQGTALRIDNMRNGKVTRVEIMKSL